MALSKVVIPGDGTTTLVPVDFALGYIDVADITCRVGEEVDGTGNPVYRSFTFQSPTLVQVAGTPAAVGENYVFTRTVVKDELIVDWEDGDPITNENLNLMQKQALMIAHEALDMADAAVKTTDGTSGPEITRGVDGQYLRWDAEGNIVPGALGGDIENAQAYAAAAEASATAAGISEGNAAASATNAAGEADRAFSEAERAKGEADRAATDTAAAIATARAETIAQLTGDYKTVFFAAGATTVVLPNDPGTKEAITLYQSGLAQHPDTFTFGKPGGIPTVTLTSPAVAAGWIKYQVSSSNVIVPADGTFGPDKWDVSSFMKTFLQAMDVAAARTALKDAWELIETKSINSQVTTDFINLSAFRRLRLSGYLSCAAAEKMYFLVSTNNGASWISGATDYVAQVTTRSGTTLTTARVTTSAGQLSETVNAGGNTMIRAEFDLWNPAATGRFMSRVTGVGSTLSYYGAESEGIMSVAGVYDALRIVFGNNALHTGMLTLEGMR